MTGTARTGWSPWATARVIRHIAPLARNRRRALGVNVQSIPNSAEAIARSLPGRDGPPPAPFELTQEISRTSKLGVVIYQRTPARQHPAGPHRRVCLRHRPHEDVFRTSAAIPADGHRLPGRDRPRAQGDRRLAGSTTAPRRATPGEGGVLPWVEIFDFAGRTWSLSFVPEPARPSPGLGELDADRHRPAAWPAGHLPARHQRTHAAHREPRPPTHRRSWPTRARA